MSPSISLVKAGTLWGKHIHKFTEHHLLHKKKNPQKSSESHVNAKLIFRNSQRETSYLEFSQCLPEGKSVHADSYCKAAPKFPKGPSPHFDRCSSNRDEERGLASGVHLQTSAACWVSIIFEGNWQIGLAGNPGPSRPAVWGLLQYPQNLQWHWTITRQVQHLSLCPILCSREPHGRIFQPLCLCHWGSCNRLA